MDLLLGFLSGEFSKVAIFLLLFAAAALVFEIFYFRRRREHEIASSQTSVDFVAKHPRSTKKTVFIIVGILLIFVLLPASVIVVFQQVNVEKQAQAPPQSTQPAQPTIACDQIDLVSGQRVVEPSAVALGDTISFVGYCYITGTEQATISKLRFVLTTPSGEAAPVEFLAFAAASKNRENRRYYQATYPNIRISEAGSHKIEVWGFSSETGLTKVPFSRSFSVALSGGRLTPTPTVTQGQQTAGNQPPTCSSLSAIPLTGPAPLTVSLTGTGSDGDGQVTAFEFTFGDGTRETVNKVGSATTSHVYQAAGSYTASLRVQDNDRVFSASSSLCRVTINVSTGSSATTSAQLKAQPTRAATPIPTKVALPEAGVSLPMVGFVTAGLVMLTFGLLLAF